MPSKKKTTKKTTVKKTPAKTELVVSLADPESIAALPMTIYRSEKNLKTILGMIEAEARSLVPDVTTAKGRAVIKTNAADVGRSKVAMEKFGKGLVDAKKAEMEEALKEIDDINALRRLSKETLAELKIEIRQPLTDYEESQKRKLRETKLAEELERHWGEALAEDEVFETNAKLAAVEAKLEEERAERIRLEDEEQARIDAEEEAKRLAAEKVRAAELQAEETARQATAAIDAANQRADDALEEDRKKREAEKIEEDRKKLAEEEAARRKSENLEHRRGINDTTVNELMAVGFTELDAQTIVIAVAKGKITHMEIKY